MNDRAGCSLAAAPPTESPLGPTDCSVCLLSLPSPCRAPPQGRWPNLERWFNAMEQRPAYLAFKSDYYTHCHDLPPQLGGCVSGGGQSSASGVTTACLSSSRQTAVPDPSSMFSPACLHAAYAQRPLTGIEQTAALSVMTTASMAACTAASSSPSTCQPRHMKACTGGAGGAGQGAGRRAG